VELAAVVLVPETLAFGVVKKLQVCTAITSGIGRALSSSLVPILGNDVLQTWTERIRGLGVQEIWLASSSQNRREENSVLGQLVRQGIERLLMIKLKSYAEMDLSDLVRFHRESGSSVTEVLDSRGRLGISLFDQFAFCEHKATGSFGGDPPTQYPFAGYAKRILSATERQELMSDALTGACEMRPAGEQIAEQVWVGEDVSLAETARITGPSYIGDRTILRSGAIVGPFSSVERDCVVDCGTSVERTTVLPSTYLGIGLMFRNAQVDGGELEDLDSGAVANLESAGLSCRIAVRNSKRETFDDTMVFSPDGNAWLRPRFAAELQQAQA
jgi:hypothetical protein